MEDSLRESLNRLTRVARRETTHSSTGPEDESKQIIQKISEMLEQSHEDEMPALSAIFLDSDIGVLAYVKETAHMNAKDVQAARAKAFDAISNHLERMGPQKQSSASARDIRDLCIQQFRSEQQNTTKAAALGPILALFKLQLPIDHTDEEMKKVGESLRRDYERTAKTPTIKSAILKTCAALHANFDIEYKTEDFAKCATPKWLMEKALTILDEQIGAGADNSDDDDEDNNNNEGEDNSDKGAENKGKKKIDMVMVSGALFAIASSLQSVPDTISSNSRITLSKIMLKALEPPKFGSRSEISKAAMKVVECVGESLKKEFIEFAPEIFEKLLELRVCSNKDVARNALISLDAFLITLRDALMDNTLFEEKKRVAVMKSMMDKIKELLEQKYEKGANPRKITVAVRALGKLAKPAFYLSSEEMLQMDLDELMEQLARFTLEEKFTTGGNDFEKRFESMERQVALLVAYTDVLELQQTVDEATLDIVASILRWVFEHYSNEVDTRKRVVHDAIVNLFQTLYERGGALRSLFSRCGQSLVHLTLRVGPPDPIDRLLANAPSIQMWPKYVDLWVRLLGGAEKYEKFNPRKSKQNLNTTPPSIEGKKKRTQSVDSAGRSERSLGINDGMEIDTAIDEQIAVGAANATYDCFMEHILLICSTLELDVRESKTATNAEQQEKTQTDANISEDLLDNKNEVNVTTDALIALNLEGNLEAKNPGDMQTFLGLVDFYREVIGESPSKQISSWIGQLGEELMALATKHTALSGFYKLVQISLLAAERSGYFQSVLLLHDAKMSSSTNSEQISDDENESRKYVTRNFQNFLYEVLGESSSKTGELRAASLAMILEAPDGLLPLKDLVPALCSVLELGLQHPRMAEIGLKVFEKWLTNRQKELIPSLPQCVRSLRPYLDRGDEISQELEIDRNKAMALINDTDNSNLRTGSVAEWRFEKRMAKQALVQGKNSDEQSLLTKILRILGSVGSYSHFLVNSLEEDEQSLRTSDKDSFSSSTRLWDSTLRISVELPLYATEATLWLDNILPRVAQLALRCRDRATKVAACEALHAMTLLMIGKNAQRPDAGNNIGATPFHQVYRSLFPVILDLAVDFEPVTSTLFHKLAFQLARWFTKNQVREAAETMALLDAITIGLSSSRFGAKRDLCAALAAESLKWSLKQMTDDKNDVNVKSILRRLYSLMSHPDSNKRLGAVSALTRCLNEFETGEGSATDILQNHVLEMLEVTLRSFRLSSTDSKDPAEDATARLSHLIVRMCKRHAGLLKHSLKSRSGTFQTLRDIVVWVFDDGVARPERRLRQESQFAFCVLQPACEDFNVLQHVKENGLPFSKKASTISTKKNMKNIVAPNSQQKCEYAISWLKIHISVFHFSRWSLEVKILPPEVLSRELDIFQTASEYLQLLDIDHPTNVGPTLARKWRRAKVNFLLQVLIFVHTSLIKFKITAEESCENLALKAVVVNDGFVKLIVDSFLRLEKFETEQQEEKYISTSAAELLKELNLLIKDKPDRIPEYLKVLNSNVLQELSQGLCKDTDGDLGSINLASTSGCSKAARLATGYRKLFDIQLLRSLLPLEELQGGRFGERLVVMVYSLGKIINPRQKAVGLEILKLAFQLGVSADHIMSIILRKDNEWEEDSFITTGQQHTNSTMVSTQRRREKRMVREQEMGELFYMNFYKLITSYVIFDFGKYAEELLSRAATDTSSPGGRIATHLLISVLTETARAGISHNGKAINPSSRPVLLEFTKRIVALDPLVQSDSSRSNDIVSRCQRRALAIIERALFLDASLEPNRVLLRTKVESEKKDQINAAYFLGDALSMCLRIQSSSSARIEAIRIATQTLLHRNSEKSICSEIVTEALIDLVKRVKALGTDQWDSSGIAEATKDAILRSFRISSSKPQLIRIILPLIEDESNDQTLKFMSKALSLEGNAWDEALAVELFDIAFENDRESYQRRVCGRLLRIILMHSSSFNVCNFISARIDAVVNVLEQINKGASNLDSEATSALNAYTIVNALYQKCSKEEIMNGPIQRVPKLNQKISLHSLNEIKGVGISSKLCGVNDEASELVLRLRQCCFETFSALLNRTQTKLKFFDILLQGGPQRFNGMFNKVLPLYMEAIWSRDITPTPWNIRDDELNKGKDEGENALPFTVSSTLLSLDPTLAQAPSVTERYTSSVSVKAEESLETMNENYMIESSESLSASIRDNLEQVPISNGFYFLLDVVIKGGFEDNETASAIIERIVGLLKDSEMVPHFRFAIAKAVLRAQRVSIDQMNLGISANEEGSIKDEKPKLSSLFRTVAPELMSAVIYALIDVSKFCNENIIHSPIREVTVMSLECVDSWTADTRCALSSLLCCIVRNAPTGSVVELRENITLGTRLARVLRDSVLSCFNTDTVSRTFGDVLKEMQTLVKTKEHDQTARSRRIAGVQMIGAFVADGIIDVSGKRALVLYNSDVISELHWKSDIDLTRPVVNFCLMTSNSTNGRQCHEAAASLIGMALAKRAASETMEDEEPKWKGELITRLRHLQQGKLDIFLIGLDRISKHYPSFPYETEFASLIQSSLEKTYGETRYVALCALSHDITSSRNNIACTKQLLPRIKAFLENRDPQTHALLLEILARGIIFAKREGDLDLLNDESKRLWLDTTIKIDHIFQFSSPMSVKARAAHAKLCAAILQAFPEFYQESSVIGPLFRAIADPSVDAGRIVAQEHWQRVNKCWTLGERLLNLMKTPPSANAEDSWIAATCALMLSIPENHTDYEQPVSDYDLADCILSELNINCEWNGSSLPMTPLFSTLGTQGPRSSLSSTLTTAGLLGSGRRFGSGNSVALPQKSAPGLVRATPAAPGTLAISATQSVHAATLMSDMTKLRSFGNNGISATLGGSDEAGDLPDWVMTEKLLSTTLQKDPLFGSTIPLTPQTKVSHRSTLKTTIDGSSKWSEKRTISQDYYKSKEESASSLEARRYRALQKHTREQRKHEVHLVRRYRDGELPDVKISRAEILAPLLVLAKRDSSISVLLLSAIWNATHSEKGLSIKSSYELVKDAKPGETLQNEVRQLLSEFAQNIKGTNVFLASWVLKSSADDKNSKVSAEDLRRIAFAGDCLAAGTFALESFLMSAGDKKILCDAPTSTFIWRAMAGLHRAAGDGDAALLAVTRAFPGDAKTHSALKAQLAGNARKAAKIYKTLKQENMSLKGTAEVRFWTRERVRCAERLGEWTVAFKEFDEDIKECIKSGDWREASNFLAVPAGEELRGVSGEASGGDLSAAAIRIGIREPDLEMGGFLDFLSRSGTDKLDRDHARNASLMQDFGVEFAVRAFVKGHEDASRTVIRDVRDRFASRWSATHPRAVALRRALLQSLQPSAEIEEVLQCAAAARIPNYDSSEESAFEVMLKSTLSKWKQRWPSESYDSAEVWERVASVRSICLQTLSNLANQTSTDLIKEASRDAYWHASRGLRRVGESNLSLKFFKKFSTSIDSEKKREWSYIKATIKVKMLLAKEKPEDLESILSSTQNRELITESLIKLHKAEIKNVEGSICEKLWMLKQNDQLNNLANDTINCYITAESCASAESNTKLAAKASLNLARFCDELLKDAQVDDVKNVTIRATLVKHVLKALKSGSKACNSARHLLPRVLALLRNTEPNSQTIFEFKIGVELTPAWYFLDWISQLVSLLSSESSHEAVSSLVSRLVASYPAAMHPHFSLGRNTLTPSALKIGEELLRSPVAKQFERAVTLLDFPLSRLKWWKEQIERVEQENKSSADSTYGVTELIKEMLSDVGKPEEKDLGHINVSFAKIARQILNETLKAWSGEKEDSVSKLLHAAVIRIEKDWKRHGSKEMESKPTLPLERFSHFFSSFEQTSYGGGSEQFMTSLEIPGQYDSLSQAPDPTWHAKVVSFETSATVFTNSKQKPKKIVLRSSDGREYAFIAKGSEDLRQDERVQKLFRAMDQLLTQSPCARAKALRIRTFHVLPLTKQAGLIEFVHNTEPMGRVLINSKEDAEKQQNVTGRHQSFIQARATFGLSGKKRKGLDDDANNSVIKEDAMGVLYDQSDVPQDQRIDMKIPDDYLVAMANADSDTSRKILRGLAHFSPPSDAIRQKLHIASGCPEAFLAARRVFAASLAASSIAGWIVGLGDRHPENILLDVSHGSLCHIDFGYAFGTGTSALPIPEIAPFRMTRTLIGTLAPLDAKAWLEIDMARVMTALQSGKNLLGAAMEIFITDPILDWNKERNISDDADKHVEMKVMHANSKLSLVNPASICIEQCLSRHGEAKYWEGLEKLIKGLDDRSKAGHVCENVEEQVKCLMEMATDPNVLANSWSGWKAWN